MKSMAVKNIVRGQKVSVKTLVRAKELHRELTPAEKILWKEIKANKLSGLHFRRQQIIHGYFADFYCHQHELVVELDGDIHDFQKEYDAEREAYLISLGFRVIRFKNEEVMDNLNGVLRKILEVCKDT
jgi:very-short-patch-repair endonuclease